MKTKKYNRLIAALFALCASALFSCSEQTQSKEPNLKPSDAQFIEPEAPLITPEQATVIREIVIEYNNAVAD